MSRAITKAIAVYQAAVTPAAVKKALKASVGLPLNAADIRAGAAMALQDVLAAEIAR
jgi:hypothetical protein